MQIFQVKQRTGESCDFTNTPVEQLNTLDGLGSLEQAFDLELAPWSLEYLGSWWKEYLGSMEP
jgi:hypothetical protein